MPEPILETAARGAVVVHAVLESGLEALLARRSAFLRTFAATSEFKARAGQLLVAPNAEGGVERVLFGLGAQAGAQAFRALGAKLTPGAYRLADLPEGVSPTEAAMAFALGTYRYDRYRKPEGEGPRLFVPGADIAEARRIAHACALARDMVNTPANDMGPLQIETIAREIAEQYGAQLTVIAGEGLLEANYPAVHAVGRAAAAARAPRLLELHWGEAERPLVVVIGKGVVFDTGGLDIKPSAGMRLMKKDMGGAAHALALGRMIMDAGLPVRLAVLAPVVENAIGGDAMRPGDVLATRSGLTVEVGNTDAEGRLILADALTRAGELSPALTLDLATLTGAARAALGPEIPPFFTDDDELASAIEAASEDVSDPLWRMPLWKGYGEALDSDIADLRNDPDGWAQAGSVTAALFLQRFAPPGPWAHFDIFAWNSRGRAGRPVGGEAQAIRTLYRMIRDRFA